MSLIIGKIVLIQVPLMTCLSDAQRAKIWKRNFDLIVMFANTLNFIATE
jgi:hypothetical protein